MRQLTAADLPKFSQINPSKLEPQCKKILSQLRNIFYATISQQGPFTWENLFEPLETAVDELLNQFWLPVVYLKTTAKSKKLLAAIEKCELLLLDYENEISQNKDWLTGIRSIANNQDYFYSLDIFKQKAINQLLKKYGVKANLLTARQSDKRTTIEKELILLKNQFDENIIFTNNNKYIYWPAEYNTTGLSEEIINNALKEGKKQQRNAHAFPIKDHILDNILISAENGELRKAAYKAKVTQASQSNLKVIQNIINKRIELANMHGYNSYANWACINDFTRNANDVQLLLEKLITAVKPAALKEHNNIANFAKEKIGIEHLQAWDINFATEKYKEYIINFEEDSLQDYFYLPNVLNGLFDLLYKFYDLKFERDNEVDTWDSYVQFYRVYNNNQLLGGIYFDLFERSNKDPGSWMTEAQHRRQYKDGSYQPTISFITCDFEHPTSPEAPVLLHHSEIIILFHETGHVLQHLLSKSTEASVSGTLAVPAFAIEIPSIYLETWAKNPEVIKGFARHYETNKVIPNELLNKLIQSQNFQPASELLYQLELALFDVNLHNTTMPITIDHIKSCFDEVRQKTSFICTPRYNHSEANFEHIFSGEYGSLYNAYIYSNMLASSLYHFSSPQKIKETFLSYGGCRSQKQMYFECTGKKELSVSEFLAQKGIPTTGNKISGKRRECENSGIFDFFKPPVQEKFEANSRVEYRCNSTP